MLLFRRAPRLGRLLAKSLVCLLAAGCAVERWPVFDVDWEQELADRPLTPINVPESLKPSPSDSTRAPLLPPDGPVELSVEQAVLLALSGNRDLRVQQLTPVINAAFERIERGAWDPEVFADASAGQQRATEVSRATGEQFSVEADDAAVSGGVRQRLPTGTTVELEAEDTLTSSNRTPDQHEARVGLTVTQSLLQGFGPAVNLATVRQARLETLASLYELRGFTEALLAETETTYWLYALARREIVIFEASLELARQQLDETQQRVDVGVLPPTEIAAAQAEVALREQALIDARSELESQRFRLVRLMSPDLGEATLAGLMDRAVLPSSDIETQATPIEDLPLRLQLAQRLRPELNEARLRLQQNRLETIVTRNGLLPRLDLFVTLGRSGYSEAFGDAIEDLIDGDSYDLSAGASFSWFLGNRAAEGRHLVAIATAQQAAAAIENLAQLVHLDVRLAATEVERSRQQIGATAATRALREEALRAEQERFRVGSSTNLLVAQAQRDLLQSQISEVEAIVAYRIALINLYLAEGSLLERRGIRIGNTLPALPADLAITPAPATLPATTPATRPATGPGGD